MELQVNVMMNNVCRNMRSKIHLSEFCFNKLCSTIRLLMPRMTRQTEYVERHGEGGVLISENVKLKDHL
jgi:hypothetical protein